MKTIGHWAAAGMLAGGLMLAGGAFAADNAMSGMHHADAMKPHGHAAMHKKTSTMKMKMKTMKAMKKHQGATTGQDMHPDAMSGSRMSR